MKPKTSSPALAPAGCNHKTNMAKKISNQSGGKEIEQTFTFPAKDAARVQLAGDFTHWDAEPIKMRKTAAGVWQTSVKLKPGEHHYRFLVDGQWQDDPACTVRVPNPFGGQDCVCRVG